MLSFGKMFARRTASCFFVMCLMFMFCAMRIATISTGEYAEMQAKQSGLRLTIARPRGTVYDRNMLPLNNQQSYIVAAVSPTPKAVMAISEVLQGDERLEDILERLAAGKPVVCEVPRIIESEGIVCVNIRIPHVKTQLAEHTVGYTDSSGHGVTGLEAAFDHLLYSENTIDAVFFTDGHGKVLEGDEILIEGTETAENYIVTTLDSRIQEVVEKALLNIEMGAAVVCDASSGEILAAVSRPSFDCTNISAFLYRDDSPLLNRTLASYSVGSVFKPCVAAAGLEAGKNGFVTECNGALQIAERNFRCHNYSGHGTMELNSALAHSCNVYFYSFAALIGGEAIYKMASSLNFGGALYLAEGYKTASGVLPDKSDLLNEAALANLSIGQGRLLLSPTSILTLYCAIATDGSYCTPNLVTAVSDGGQVQKQSSPTHTRVMSSSTAAVLREYLTGVITNGTGIPAKPVLCTAAGKTATAQTGKYNENGKEITNGWFCGFFPAENPKYVVSIMSENASGSDIAPTFAAIADGITSLYALK